MRLFTAQKRLMHCGRRRGITFIEVISSLIIVAMMCSMVVTAGALFMQTTTQTTHYAKLQIYGINLIEKLQTDLTNHEVIDALDYSDDGMTSGIRADAIITDIGSPFNKPLYHVELRLRVRGSDDAVTTHTLLREGCTAYAP